MVMEGGAWGGNQSTPYLTDRVGDRERGVTVNGVCGPCDFSVSPSPFGFDFWTSESGLTISEKLYLDI